MTDKPSKPTAAASEERPPTTGSRRVDQILGDATCSCDQHGVPTWYVFLMDGDRYIFDVALASEWRQFDTDQDAAYFGIWTCKQRLLILRYLEGDLCLDAPSTPISYNQAIERMCEFYGPAACTDAKRSPIPIESGQ